MTVQVNPKTDLVLERIVDVPCELVWNAWTQPEQLKKWFCPDPWKATECEIDLRPGGIFRTLMRGPEGETSPHIGCYLEVVPNERLVWTDALLPGWRPAPKPSELGFFFTAIITMETQGKGTRYRAHVIHKDEESRNKHDTMGFAEGWGAAWEQLVAVAKGTRR